MSDADAYLRELRRALPFGYRRRFVAEVREHFDSAIAAEATRGVERPEAERLTIERLGPAQAVADQLLDDLRRGAIGRAGRLTVALTAKRAAVLATVLAVAIAAGGVFAERHSSRPPAPPQRSATSATAVVPTRTVVGRLVLALRVAGFAPPHVPVRAIRLNLKR